MTVKNVSNDGLSLGKMTVSPPPAPPVPYAEYAARYAGRPIAEAGCTVINATDYEMKNSSKIIYQSAATPDVRPYDAEYKKLNTLNWTEPGDEISYRFHTDAAGVSVSLYEGQLGQRNAVGRPGASRSGSIWPRATIR